ncbi:MAG: hypothetical protein JNM85_03760 [Chthonomonas sp.]|nr:hypothetical protein [Chthonomonas sp.]
MKFLGLLTTLSILTSSALQSDEAVKDQAKKALEATGLKFETTASGKNYSIVFTHPENRQHTVYMSLTPNRPGKLITYNLYTQVWYSKDAPDDALMRKILGRTKKLGAFYLFKDSHDTWTLRYNVKFDATDMPEIPKAEDKLVKALKDCIFFVNAVGEETDKELNGAADIQ